MKYMPSQQLCESISTGVCEQEWALASSLNENNLPSCGDLPDGTYFVIVFCLEDAQLVTTCLLCPSFVLISPSVYGLMDQSIN